MPCSRASVDFWSSASALAVEPLCRDGLVEAMKHQTDWRHGQVSRQACNEAGTVRKPRCPRPECSKHTSHTVQRRARAPRPVRLFSQSRHVTVRNDGPFCRESHLQNFQSEKLAKQRSGRRSATFPTQRGALPNRNGRLRRETFYQSPSQCAYCTKSSGGMGNVEVHHCTPSERPASWARVSLRPAA